MMGLELLMEEEKDVQIIIPIKDVLELKKNYVIL